MAQGVTEQFLELGSARAWCLGDWGLWRRGGRMFDLSSGHCVYTAERGRCAQGLLATLDTVGSSQEPCLQIFG